MIHGDKAAGYFETHNGQGYKIEGEVRQCVHCQFLWEYKPGSGTRRGYCMKCQGLMCARPECIAQQKQMTGNNYDCITVEEYNNRVRAYVEKNKRLPGRADAYEVTDDGKIVTTGSYETTPSGIMVPK